MKFFTSILLIIPFFLSSFSCVDKTGDPTKGEASTEQTDVQDPSYMDINVADFKKKVLEVGANAVIIDVRTEKEISAGKIEGALEMDFYQDDFNTNILNLDKKKTYFIYCRSGNRSGRAGRFMSENGYMKVYNLEGGFDAWKNQQ